MSIRATNFVRSLRGFSPAEKAVLFAMADHSNVKTGLTTASMTTIAMEAGLKNRETASRIAKRLVVLRVITTNTLSKGGSTTSYKMNYDFRNCDSTVTVRSFQP